MEKGPEDNRESLFSNKLVLWLIFIIIVMLMSYGVYLTHPIKNHIFDGTLLGVWFVLSIVAIPVALYAHYFLHNKVVEKKLGGNASVKKGHVHKKSEADFLEGCANVGCLGVGDDLAIMGLVWGSVLVALITGVIFAPLLLAVEFIIAKIADLDTDQYGEVHWMVMVANGLVILYATYFIALFIASKFIGVS